MDATETVAAFGGAARWKPLVKMGVTDGRLRAAVRAGDLVRLGPVYATPDAPADAVTATNLDGRLNEIDGIAHHSSRDQFRNDRTRANLVAEKGFVLLRFSYEDVMFRSEQMMALIRYIHATR